MYRTIDTDTWDDPWFAELTPKSKLLFIYLVTNRRSTSSGCFEITEKAMCFETGIREEAVKAALEEIAGRIVWWPEHNMVFVRNFYKHQHARSNKDNFRKSAVASIKDIPSEVRRVVEEAYPEFIIEEPIPIPYPSHGDKETVQVTVKGTEKETEGVVRARFEKFWDVYPKKAGRKVALKSWERIDPDDALTDVIVASVVAHTKSQKWIKDGGQFICDPSTFLNQERWKDQLDVPNLRLIAGPPPEHPDWWWDERMGKWRDPRYA